ncbi:MAG TPA: metallophosphoesterase [Streptosporangiaceae bacterium]
MFGRALQAAARRRRTRTARLLTTFAAALAGGYVGLMLGAHATTALGPADIRLSLTPSWTGDTVIDVAPLGTLRVNTHDGPLGLRASLTQIRLADARRLIDSPEAVNDLETTLAPQVRHGLFVLGMQTLIATTISGGLAGLVVFRSPRRAGWTSLTAAGTTLVVFGVSAATFHDGALAEPRYTGILAAAPSVVGDAETIVTRFSKYREELARLVTNVSRLYEVGSTLPVYSPDPSTVRVLHVSDIHLNPAAWNVIRSIVRQFRVQVVVDSGDLTDHGTGAENAFVKPIGRLRVPYVFVRGNHDSRTNQRAVARQRGAHVLDGDRTTIDGIRFFGVGDPRFTPDKSTRDAPDEPVLTTDGQKWARRVAAYPTRTDVVIVHDPVEGAAFSGTTPLVLSGHTHRRATRLLPTGTRLFVQGSTGGAGLRGLEHEKPTPFECSVLYFDRDTHRLQAWDNITLGGLGENSVEISRHLEPHPRRPVTPAPTTPPATPAATTPSGSRPP